MRQDIEAATCTIGCAKNGLHPIRNEVCERFTAPFVGVGVLQTRLKSVAASSKKCLPEPMSRRIMRRWHSTTISSNFCTTRRPDAEVVAGRQLSQQTICPSVKVWADNAT